MLFLKSNYFSLLSRYKNACVMQIINHNYVEIIFSLEKNQSYIFDPTAVTCNEVLRPLKNISNRDTSISSAYVACL